MEPNSVQWRAGDELVRAEARLLRARAGEIEFGKVERACYLVASLAFVLVVLCGAVLGAEELRNSGLVGLLAVRALALTTWLRGRR